MCMLVCVWKFSRAAQHSTAHTLDSRAEQNNLLIFALLRLPKTIFSRCHFWCSHHRIFSHLLCDFSISRPSHNERSLHAHTRCEVVMKIAFTWLPLAIHYASLARSLAIIINISLHIYVDGAPYALVKMIYGCKALACCIESREKFG
jgi:hypothetical protein